MPAKQVSRVGSGEHVQTSTYTELTPNDAEDDTLIDLNINATDRGMML